MRDAATARRDAIADRTDAVTDGRDATMTGRDGSTGDAPVRTDARVQDAHNPVDRPADGSDARRAPDGGSAHGGGPETSKCAAGRVRVHVRDIWSPGVSPTLNILPGAPAAIRLVLQLDTYDQQVFAARLDSVTDVAGGTCAYYSACIPNTTIKISLQPAFPTGCPSVSSSAGIDVSAVNRSEFWIEYTGTSSTLPADYAAAAVGPGKFQVSADSSKLVSPACKMGVPPPQSPVAGTIRVHFRWPWTDPSKTGYPGGACGDDQLGYSPPPYPTSLDVSGPSCDLQALLELQNGACTWYSVLVPRDRIPTNTDAWLFFQYPAYLVGLETGLITLPTASKPADEYWVAFTGGSNGADASLTPTCGSVGSSSIYTVTTQNPGPAYPGCGESD
ncbi:MAG TPA: hypothetical protein VHO67_16150 [Polyangia bacterium]|nr:hypothetical protein [Polyangia bacterium]